MSARKTWGCYHRRKKDGPERLVFRGYDKVEAENYKWGQLGMGGYAPGEKFIVKKIPA
jgi:hypothetical protein